MPAEKKNAPGKGLAKGLGPAQPINIESVRPGRKTVLPDPEQGESDGAGTTAVRPEPSREPER